MSRASVENTIPILSVSDLQASLDYYTKRLGFSVDWCADTTEQPFAGLSRDGHALYLCQGGQGQPGSWVWMGVEDATAFYAEYQASGARILHGPVNYPWALELQVADPDGNVLRLGSEPLSDAVSGLEKE